MKKGMGIPYLNHSTTQGWPFRGWDTSHPRITFSPARAVTNWGSSRTPWAPGRTAFTRKSGRQSKAQKLISSLHTSDTDYSVRKNNTLIFNVNILQNYVKIFIFAHLVLTSSAIAMIQQIRALFGKKTIGSLEKRSCHSD